mmetsp:Transcript_27298/g.45511  ORF Transcript_27298/g.45511 Transcript_27298/m.45511 type:complete len:422 (+) Transcript_27298:245-1510(+)|eukprot:CAMPEP_0119333356 /NCGR_PEP_ID=MMETSP1333-20130426/84992_1 /TAXON_ID=418940 /ORGANISM="Scyphosphaera apsteinii, Strain RCC1455" /LENGTH=421 /DNA_ID=CAMNT_0007343405 /DNA_START=236 /DNA_END=1501 /DNA_ORIENTATION=+
MLARRHPLIIDGSTLEGGGQVVRSCLSLAWMQKDQAIHIHSIRAGRPKPGLANQHLVGARLAALLCGRHLSGDQKGSTELSATPDTADHPLPATLLADAITPGAVSLILQAALPPLLFCAPGRELILRGGTDVSFSPPSAHTSRVLAPLLKLMGVQLDLRVVMPCFSSAGPLGEVRCRAQLPSSGVLQPLDLVTRGTAVLVHGVVTTSEGGGEASNVCNVALQQVLESMACLQGANVLIEQVLTETVIENGRGGGRMGGGRKGGGVEGRGGNGRGRSRGRGHGGGRGDRSRKMKIDCSVQLAVTTDTGCVLSANVLRSVERDGRGSDGLVSEVCKQLNALLASGACACEHTTDQLIVFMALAKGTSRLKAPPIECLTSQHLPTVLHFAQLLTGATFRVTTEAQGGCQMLECDGIGAIASAH